MMHKLLSYLDRIPIRLRLSLGHALWMAVLFASLGVGVYRLVEHDLHKSVDAALLTSARSIRKARSNHIYFKLSPFSQAFLSEFFGEPFIKPIAQLVDLSGRISEKSEDMHVSLLVTPRAISRAEHGFETFETFKRKGQPPLRQITLPVLHQGNFTGELIQVAAPLDATYHTLKGLSLMLWTTVPAGLVLSVFFGYLLTARSLRPVRAISRTAAQFGIEDLNKRLKLSHAKDELKDLTVTLNGMLDRLEDAFASLRRFAGDVSHELRTPLAVLRGEAEYAIRKKRSNEEYEQSLKTILRESVHMSNIVEDLLLLARAQGKAVKLEFEKIDVREFVNDLVNMVKPIYEQKNVTLSVSVSSHSPLEVSRSYLSLALKNILINAVKHSPQGLKVHLNVFQNEVHSFFEIKDQGEGIPQKALPHIFDPFFRADTARNRSSGGAGIGLSLAMALIKLHNGTLSVTSEEDKGATFVVSLPLNLNGSGKLS